MKTPNHRYHLIDDICHELVGTEATKAAAMTWARIFCRGGQIATVFDSMARHGAPDTWTFMPNCSTPFVSYRDLQDECV